MKTRQFLTTFFTLSALLVTSGSATADLTTGLVAYYPFNGNANDESGNGNNGIVNGATLTADRFGKNDSAYLFDGSSNYIQLADSGTLAIGLQSYSVAAWIKPISPTNNGRIFSKGSSNCVTGYMMRMGGPDGSRLHLENAFNGQCYTDCDSTQSIVDGNWHFVVGVVDRAVGASIYIDGKFDSSQAMDTSAYDLSNSRNPTIGKNDVGDYEFFNGNIDEVRVYNRALSAAEVQSLYNATKSLYSQYLDITTIPDINGDGVVDQAVLAMNVDKYYLRTIDSATGKQLKQVALGATTEITPSALTAVGKKISVLITKSTGVSVLQLRDNATLFSRKNADVAKVTNEKAQQVAQADAPSAPRLALALGFSITENNIVTFRYVMNIQELELAVTCLSKVELNLFSTWFEEFIAEQWDQQIETDILTGRLDAAGKRADHDFENDCCTLL